jgi:hypothetical protein
MEADMKIEIIAIMRYCFMKSLTKLVKVQIIIGLMLCTNTVFAADVYMSTTGTKTSGKSTVGNWSNANCYNNLAAAFSAMSGSDTLTIDDGTYTGNINSITQSSYPPSGASGNYTIVRARNIPCQSEVACNQPLKVYFQSTLVSKTSATGAVFNISNFPGNNPNYYMNWVKFWGIKWDGTATYRNCNYLYFKQVASQGIADGNTATVSISGRYNILEDVVAFGKGRYKFLFYDATRESHADGPGYNVCRRCIARHDWVSTSMPMAAFNQYLLLDTTLLNAMVIDSDSPSHFGTPLEIGGAFYSFTDSTPTNYSVNGSIVVNSAFGLSMGGTATATTFTDVVAVKTAGGFNQLGPTIFNRLTLVNVSPSYWTFADNQAAVLYGTDLSRHGLAFQDWRGSASTMANSIFRNIDLGSAAGGQSNSYFNTYLIGNSDITGSNKVVIDPYTHGLLYPVRVETGSTLATGGSGGGQMGARILNKLGKDGARYGDTDWNTEQESLWPWPMEGWVKAEMASMASTIGGDTMPSPTRGFAGGMSKDGSAQTLTKYIWEYLGNRIPDSIYKRPSPVPGVRIQ